MGGTEVLHEDRKLRVTSRKNLVIAVWSAVPEVAQLRALNRVLERFSKSKQGAYGMISAVVRGVPSFSQEVRDELVKMMKGRANEHLGSAHLILVDGLTGTAVRAFMSTVLLLARPPTPQRVFGSADEAITWLHGLLQRAPEPWAVKELREALDEAIKGR